MFYHNFIVWIVRGCIDLFGAAFYIVLYHIVPSMENQTIIRESIEVGETGYLKEWLETITIDDDYIDNRRQAHQLLQRLEQVAKTQEYKPLAKIEELEDGNYDKIEWLN